MNLRPVYAIFYRYTALLKASPSRLLGLYIWMLIDMVLWGFFSTYLGTIVSGFNTISTLLGAVLMCNFFSRTMLNMNMAFFEDMWARNFLTMFASPIRISEYLLGLILCGTVTSVFGLFLAFGSAGLLFGFSPVAYGAVLIPLLMILFLFGIALGIFGCAVVLAKGPASEWFIWPIPALITPFVGVYYPVATLPVWMQQVAKILPPSYVFEGIRSVLAGNGLPESTLLYGFGIALLYIALAALYFARTYRRVIRSGLIARYSAETSN